MVASAFLLVAACTTTFASKEALAAADECSLIHKTTLISHGKTRAVSFRDFVIQHGRTYLPDSDEYVMREALFEARAKMVHEVNSKPSQSWTAGINKLADRTNDELKALRGYNRHLRAGTSAGSAGSGSASSEAALVELDKPKMLIKQGHITVPKDLNWGDKLTALAQPLDQGGCGSCWAFAAGNTLRAQSEIHVARRDFSLQELVSCVPNPDHCGGDGGCSGATVELAMDYVLRYGSLTEQEYPYTGTDDQCPMERQAAVDAQMMNHHSTWEKGSGNKGEAYGMVGWMRLPENKVLPVKQALVTHGPLGVALMVSDFFQMYQHGILPACEAEAVINHAVTLVGFGEDESISTKFWRIQNSWGADWGEHGYLRLLRQEDDAEEGFCGWDNQPEVGNGCNGGPEKVWVCGTCGILNDVVSPIFRGGPSYKQGFAYNEFSSPALFKAPANATIDRH